MAQTVVLKVSMSCEGCAGAVRRVLSKMEGVDDFHIDMKEQKVTVKGSMQPDEVFQKVSKTGKKTSLWERDQTKDTKAVTEIKEKEEENEATESVAEDKSSVALV